MAAHKTKGLRIATRCTTMDQFIAAFHRFVDVHKVFISTLNPRSVGLETAFSIDLADNTPALRGVGVVLQSWTTPQNPYGRPGIQLGIRRLTSDSEPIFDRLLFAREATAPTPTQTSSIMQVIVAKPGVRRPLARTLGPDPIPPTTAPLPMLPDARERTPGGELVLPANPLMNIDDKALRGFVDCTLYEETGTFFPPQPVLADPDDPAVAPPLLAPRRPTAPFPIANPEPEAPSLPSLPSLAKPQPLLINKLTPPMGASAHVSPAQFTLPMFGKGAAPTNRMIPIETLTTAHQIAEQMAQITGQPPAPPALPPPGPPPIPGKPWLSAETAEMLDLEPDPSVVTPLPPAPMVEYSEQTYPAYDQRTHASGSYDVPRQHISNSYPAQSYRPAPRPLLGKRRVVIGVSAVASATIAIALVMASRGGSPAPTAVAPTAPTLVAANSDHVRGVAPGQHVEQANGREVGDATAQAAAPPPPDPPEADTTSDTTVVGKGPCKIAISTTPAGSTISVDGEPVGPSPLTVAGPCEKRRITISHPRYAAIEKFVMLKLGQDNQAVDVALLRPTHNLFVDTQPAGALVSIDGHRAGTSPTMIKVMGFTTLTLKIEKPGWKPTTKKLYSKTAVDRMTVKLAH